MRSMTSSADMTPNPIGTVLRVTVLNSANVRLFFWNENPQQHINQQPYPVGNRKQRKHQPPDPRIDPGRHGNPPAHPAYPAVGTRAAQAAELDRAGLTADEGVDLVLATAFFAWANRLMLSLGEPSPPPA